MKRFMSLALVGALSLSLLAGCGPKEPTDGSASASGSQQPAAESIQVAVLQSAYMDKHPDMWKDVCDAFTAQTGIKVDLVADKQLEAVIGPQIKSGKSPDFVHLAMGRPDAMTETFIKDNALAEVTDVLDMKIPGEEVTVKEKMSKGFTDSTTTNPYGDGKTYLAPMFYGPCGLFYNAGLLKEKGWEVPTTWDDMWALGDKAKAEGIALFTYPTTGYLQEFTFSLIYAVGGPELFDKITSYEEGVWESEQGQQVLDILAKLATYTEASVPANANNQDFTKNQQLILDNKAIFCPNGTWLPGEMADAPRADGFEWGMTAIPAVAKGGDAYAFAWIEQAWIPASAPHLNEAKQFMAFMYSDAAAKIFAEAGAIQPIQGLAETLEGENAMFYSIYETGAKAAMGGWAATDAVEGVNMGETLFGSVNSLVSGNLSVADWTKAIVEANNALRAAKK